jgi:hypothetical protein
MAKSALGRGLQHLMKERSASTGQAQPPEKPPVTPGMAALLRGKNGEAKEQGSDKSQPSDPENVSAATRKRNLIQASMFLADIFLLVLVARLAFVSHGHFGLFEVALCIIALAIGAWLSCLALWMK